MAYRFRLKRTGVIPGSRLKGGHALKGQSPDVLPPPPQYPEMSVLGVPLAVRLATSRRDIHVNAEVDGLRFRSQVPGGFTSADLTLNRSLKFDPDEIAPFGDVIIYDGRSGDTVWQGRMEDPGRSAGASGETFAIRATGPAAHARDRVLPLIYIDKLMDRWVRYWESTSHPDGVERMGEDQGGSGVEALHLQLPQGVTVIVNSLVGRQYAAFRYAGQKLARVDYTWDAGQTNGDWFTELTTRGSGGDGVRRSQGHNTAGGGSSPVVIVTHFPNGNDLAEIRVIVDTAGTVGDSNGWSSVMGLVVMAMLYNADGTEKTTGYSNNYYRTYEIVQDLLGRVLNKYDGAGAYVQATSTVQVDQLAYPDGTTAADVLNDLIALEDYYWAVWEESRTAAGKYRFEYREWAQVVRYEANATGGFEAPASGWDMYNAVNVRWKDSLGRIRWTRRTQTVPELDSAGLTREWMLDLGDEIASSAQATTAGDRFLAEHRYAPNKGSLTVQEPIFDRSRGRSVYPWEIRPGGLIRVRDVNPNSDALNTTLTRDGATIFRLTGVEYDAASNSARLDLDAPPVSIERMLGAGKPEARRR